MTYKTLRIILTYHDPDTGVTIEVDRESLRDVTPEATGVNRFVYDAGEELNAHIHILRQDKP